MEEPFPARRSVCRTGCSGRWASSVPPPPAAQIEGARLLDLVVAKVAAGQRDEDVFQADVAGRQAGQRPLQAVELVEQGGDGPMRLGDGQRVSVALGPGRQNRVETGESRGLQRRPVAVERELDDVVAAQPGDQLARASPAR